MTTTLVKLAFAGMRGRLLATVITVLLAATATATIVLALEVGATARDPWQRTFDAANGAHVLADVPTEADAREVGSRPGVAAADEPSAVAFVPAELPLGEEQSLQLVAPPPNPSVNLPLPVDGVTTPGDGIVLEASLADAQGLAIGDTVRFGSPSGPVEVEVVGTAISVAQPRYPRRNPGLAWVSPAILEIVQPDLSQWRWQEAVRLEDPSQAQAFADDVVGSFPPRTVELTTAEDQLDSALTEAWPSRLILTTYTVGILLVVLAVIGILIGARASQQRREIGLARAVGLTPRQVSLVFTIETTVLGLVGVLLGFAAGVAIAPTLAAPLFETLVGTPQIAPDPVHVLVAGVPVLVMLSVGAWFSTRRRSRLSVIEAMRSGAGEPGSRSRTARLVELGGAPLSLSLGVKHLLAQRGRVVLFGAAIAVTTASVVFALSMKASLDAQDRNSASDVPAALPALVYTLDAILLVISVVTLVAITLIAVREQLREFAVLRTIGFTPGQVTVSLVGAHTAAAVVAAVITLPFGVALFSLVYAISGGDQSDLAFAPWWWLALVPVGAALLALVSTVAPARIAARAPVIEALRYE